jgi:hypothetical protein
MTVEYSDIYELLPEIHAPFRMVHAFDWPSTFSRIDVPHRATATLNSLIKTELPSAAARWKFAERMAQVFESFRNARICRIQKGRSRGLLISVATNPTLEKKLLEPASDEAWNIRRRWLASASSHVGQFGSPDVGFGSFLRVLARQEPLSLSFSVGVGAGPRLPIVFMQNP